jgi:hypothetical protein
MKILKRIFIKFMLRWREMQIRKDHDRQLSREIDSLLALLERRINEI